MSELDNELKKLFEFGKINEFFFNKLQKKANVLPENLLENYIDDAVRMTSLGVSSANDQDDCYRIFNSVDDVLTEISSDKSAVLKADAVSSLVYKNRSIYPVDTTFNIFCAVSVAAQHLGIALKQEALNEIDESCSLNKKAYPQGYSVVTERPVYNVNKWMNSTREIYAKMNREFKTFDQAESEVTAKWDKMEKLNYKYWLKFYNEGVPTKYPKIATAQFHPNFLTDLKSELPVPKSELQRLQEKREQAEKDKDKGDVNNIRVRIEDHRGKLISRLNSAEKLLASMDGQFFAGDEQELMLKLLQDLKRKVQTSNKVHIKSSLFEDYIYRTGNMLKAIGASKRASNFFFKIAQDSMADPFADPFAAGIPPAGDAPAAVDTGAPDEGVVADTKQAFREFVELLDRGIYDADDDADEQQKAALLFSDIVVTAQLMDVPEEAKEEIPIGTAETAPPEDKPQQQRPKQLPGQEDLIVDDPLAPISGDQEDLVIVDDDDTDDVIVDALAHITVNDAIQRLEMLLSIYKQREIPRQLSILDLMIDKLGFSSMFPQLGEAQTKALDAGGYITSRLEEILSALKGSAESQGADEWATGKPTQHTPEENAIRADLERKNQEEKERKDKRKEQANQKLDTGVPEEKPAVGDQAADLGQPAQIAPVNKPIAVR